MSHGDNGAVLAGYTREVMAYGSDGSELHLLIRPDADLDDTFKAWCCDECEWLRVHGWNYTFEDAE